jgi:hypothetical protein
MSNYYRPPQKQAYNWREREAEAARKAAEEEQKRKTAFNETNFPSLTTMRPQGAVKGNQYAQLAQKWAIDAEVDRRMEEYKKFREASDRIEVMHRRSRESRYERHDEEYEEEMEEEPRPVRSFLDDDAGWSEVKGRTYKGPRERTVEEMDRAAQEKQEQEDMEFNGHLFDSNRHDHDRV